MSENNSIKWNINDLQNVTTSDQMLTSQCSIDEINFLIKESYSYNLDDIQIKEISPSYDGTNQSQTLDLSNFVTNVTVANPIKRTAISTESFKPFVYEATTIDDLIHFLNYSNINEHPIFKENNIKLVTVSKSNVDNNAFEIIFHIKLYNTLFESTRCFAQSFTVEFETLLKELPDLIDKTYLDIPFNTELFLNTLYDLYFVPKIDKLLTKTLSTGYCLPEEGN